MSLNSNVLMHALDPINAQLDFLEGDDRPLRLGEQQVIDQEEPNADNCPQRHDDLNVKFKLIRKEMNRTKTLFVGVGMIFLFVTISSLVVAAIAISRHSRCTFLTKFNNVTISKVERVIQVNNVSQQTITDPILQIAHILVGSQALGTSRNVQIWRVDPITFLLSPHNAISTLEIANTSLPYTSPMKILAYRPHFDDKVNSNLAVVFINVAAVFPCTQEGHAPICHLFSGEEDNFYRGRATVQAGDLGNDFRIFSDRSNHYACCYIWFWTGGVLDV